MNQILQIILNGLSQSFHICQAQFISFVRQNPEFCVYVMEGIFAYWVWQQLKRWYKKTFFKTRQVFPEVDKLKVVKTVREPIFKPNSNFFVGFIFMLLIVAGVLGATFM